MADPMGMPNGLPLRTVNLERRFLQHVRCRRLLASGQRVVVACSGGGDSTALLHLLQAVRRTLPLTLSVVHVDHAILAAGAAIGALRSPGAARRCWLWIAG